MIKKYFFCFTLFCFSITLFAQEFFPQVYKIQSSSYEIDGSTMEYALRTEVKIDYERIFFTNEELITYVLDIQQQITNLRQLETAVINIIYLDQVGEVTPVALLISAKDTWNFIAIPYPKYDSNSGLDLKIKANHYNFLGSLRTLSSDLTYKYNEKSEHILGGSLSFTYPFALHKTNVDWSNSVGLSYVFGENKISSSVNTGLSFNTPLFNGHYVGYGFTQGFSYNTIDYPGQSPYFTEQLFVNLQIQLANIDNWGKIYWIPGISFIQHWGVDAFTKGWDGITHIDLKGPSFTVSHGLWSGRVNWVGNYRDGAEGYFRQYFPYNIYKNEFTPYFELGVGFFKAFKYVGIASRVSWFASINSTRDIGVYFRGIRDANTETGGGIILNFDVPIKLFQTDWVKLGLWSWTKYFDFEFQINPFIDTGVSYNNRLYLSGGLEFLVYPTKMRSIVGRIGAGWKALETNQINDIISLAKEAVKTLWDNKFKPEIFIGIGLFY